MREDADKVAPRAETADDLRVDGDVDRVGLAVSIQILSAVQRAVVQRVLFIDAYGRTKVDGIDLRHVRAVVYASGGAIHIPATLTFDVRVGRRSTGCRHAE